jgi:hypothetical protein
MIGQALAALDADGLRSVVREVLPWLDEASRARLVGALIDRAARGRSGWSPPTPSARLVSEVERFAVAATRTGQADPGEVDEYLRHGIHAFLARDYPAALAIFRALLVPVSAGEIYLGQHEMLDEVLQVALADCTAQYVVATYMTAAPAKRTEAVLAALDQGRAEGHFWTPIAELERVAVEPLPGLAEFLPEWRSLVAARASGQRTDDWETDPDRWLIEVTMRLEGPEGLARLARRSRRAHDLRAWCRSVRETGDRHRALRAFEEAARLASAGLVRAEFLDAAAIAAGELSLDDVPKRLGRAWRASPTLLRLCRWLETSPSQRVLTDRVSEALKTCPKKAHRQRVLLHVLSGHPEQAARLLAAAPGLGWSQEEHPGHVGFWLLASLLAQAGVVLPVGPPNLSSVGDPDADGRPADLDGVTSIPAVPPLAVPDLTRLVSAADARVPAGSAARAVLLKALRTAAEKRAAGVTKEKRRRYYEHAVRLIAACAIVDRGPETAQWVAAVRAAYRRFHAMHAEFERQLDR